jgi:hypothetical protein
MKLPEIFLHSGIDKNSAIIETKEINGNIYTITISNTYIDRTNLDYFYSKYAKKDILKFEGIIIKEIKQIQIEYSSQILEEEITKNINSNDIEIIMRNAFREKNYKLLQYIQDYVQQNHRKIIDNLVKEVSLKFQDHTLQTYTWGYAPYRNLLVDETYVKKIDEDTERLLGIGSMTNNLR